MTLHGSGFFFLTLQLELAATRRIALGEFSFSRNRTTRRHETKKNNVERQRQQKYTNKRRFRKREKERDGEQRCTLNGRGRHNWSSRHAQAPIGPRGCPQLALFTFRDVVFPDIWLAAELVRSAFAVNSARVWRKVAIKLQCCSKLKGPPCTLLCAKHHGVQTNQLVCFLPAVWKVKGTALLSCMWIYESRAP